VPPDPFIERVEALKLRSKRFALSVIRLSKELPKTEEGRVIARQILRSGTSVAANYRAACRARSRAEFQAKLGVVVEEADETVFWLELLHESGMIRSGTLQPLTQEAEELLKIFAASYKTARGN